MIRVLSRVSSVEGRGASFRGGEGASARCKHAQQAPPATPNFHRHTCSGQLCLPPPLPSPLEPIRAQCEADPSLPCPHVFVLVTTRSTTTVRNLCAERNCVRPIDRSEGMGEGMKVVSSSLEERPLLRYYL